MFDIFADCSEYLVHSNSRNTNEEEAIIDLPKPRRNSIDFSKDSEVVEKKFDNQMSDFSIRR